MQQHKQALVDELFTEKINDFLLSLMKSKMLSLIKN